jgi:DNA-binding NtrC family response regulator
VDELAPDAQAVLADALDIVEFDLRALGTARTGLLQLAGEGRFRMDLACALSTLVIDLPPLGERQQDIPLLAQFFLEETNAAGGRQLSGFTPEAMDQLVSYPWPGNADEMAGLVREACRRAKGALVTAADLPEQIRWTAQAAAHLQRPEETIVLDEFLVKIEAELISRALRRAQGNKAKAARLLGVSRARLHRRVAQLGLGWGRVTG